MGMIDEKRCLATCVLVLDFGSVWSLVCLNLNKSTLMKELQFNQSQGNSLTTSSNYSTLASSIDKMNNIIIKMKYITSPQWRQTDSQIGEPHLSLEDRMVQELLWLHLLPCSWLPGVMPRSSRSSAPSANITHLLLAYLILIQTSLRYDKELWLTKSWCLVNMSNISYCKW